MIHFSWSKRAWYLSLIGIVLAGCVTAVIVGWPRLTNTAGPSIKSAEPQSLRLVRSVAVEAESNGFLTWWPKMKPESPKHALLPAASIHTVSNSRFSPRPVPILMYHYIRVNPDAADMVGYGLSVTPDDFNQQMAYLADRGYHSFSVAQVVQAMQQKITLPQPAVVITFDDGYRDLYTDAFPILQQYGLHGEAYLITSAIDSPSYVTWSMVRQMLVGGVLTVGSHTVDHPFLSRIEPSAQLDQLKQSKQLLERELGITVTDFCYPFGDYNQQVAAAVRASGYISAVTTKEGLYNLGNSQFMLPRVRVEGGQSLSGFVSQLRSSSMGVISP